MQTALATTGSKAFTMLFITDYQDASEKERRFIDTIRHNLLDTPYDNSGTWTKYTPLPKILVSLVDIVESRSKAYDLLDTNRYDVIFVSNRIEGNPIGAGYLRKIQEHHPNAMIIPLIQATQIRGAVKKDKTVNTGEGIKKIYDLGIYNCLIRNRLDLAEMIHMIHAGGRSKEDAYVYYGLNKVMPSLEDKASASAGQGEVKGEAPDKPYTGQSEQMTKEDKKEKVPDKEAADSLPATEEEQISGADSGKRLPYKERRKQEEKRAKNTGGQEQKTERVTNTEENADDAAPYVDAGDDGKFAVYQKEELNDEESNEFEKMNHSLQTRGRMNSELVAPGMLQGKVVFAKGTTALIELDCNLEQAGLSMADVFHMPVVIPYTKFADI